MSATIRRSSAVVLVLLLVGLTVLGDGVPRAKITRAGKAATVLVLGKLRSVQGSGFCINSNGVFVTNEHVVRGESEVNLVLNSGLKTARVVTARVLRTDPGLDLALLKVDGQKPLPALALAADNTVSETDELIVFGFPFGQRLALDRKESPAISVNVGKVTSLREKDGELHRIQLDAVINPGNSGGPVLDKDGKVAGVVVSVVAVSGAPVGVNFAIPVSHVHRFLNRPELAFAPPVLKLAQAHEAVEFKAEVLPLLPDSKPLELELLLKADGQSARSFKMKHKGAVAAVLPAGGVYRASAVPFPRSKEPGAYRLKASFPRGAVQGEVADLELKVGKTAVKLAEVRRVLAGTPTRVWLREGKVLKGELSGVDAVGVRLGGARVSVDLGRASEVRIHPPAGLGTLSATVVARRAGLEVGRVTRTVSVEGVAAEGEDEVFLELDVAPLEKDVVERKLDAPIANVAVGGGGRYLVLHLPKLKKLAVFDVNEARVVKLLAAPDDRVKMTAGLDKLVLALPGTRTIQRWSLKTFEQELSVPYPGTLEVLALAMGSATQGPVTILAKQGAFPAPNPFVLGLDKLDVRTTLWFNQGNAGSIVGDNVHLRSSPDGRSLGAWSSSVTPSGMHWIQMDNQLGRRTYSHSSHGHVVPGGPGGKVLFTGLGMFTSIGTFNPPTKTYPGSDPNGRFVPAHHGDYYLYLGNAATFANKNPAKAFAIHKLGVDRPILRLTGIEVPETSNEPFFRPGTPSVNVGDFTLDKRFHLVPDAKVLIVIPAGNDRLVLHRVDLRGVLDKAKREKK